MQIYEITSYYARLGVSPTAKPNEVKQAYRKLALKWHPDRNGNSQESDLAMKALNEAFDVLSNPAKKGIYDAQLSRPTWPGRPSSSQNITREDLNNFRDYLRRQQERRAQQQEEFRKAQEERKKEQERIRREAEEDTKRILDDIKRASDLGRAADPILKTIFEKNRHIFKDKTDVNFYKGKDGRDYSSYADLQEANRRWSKEMFPKKDKWADIL